MVFEALANRIHRRRYRRTYRETLKRWINDGGDNRFRFDYELDEHSVVLDLGGYEGQWANDIYSRYRCRILVFEPVGSFARNITERFRRNPDISVFQCGLGATSRMETIYVHGAGSSTLRKRSNAERIEIVAVDKWFEEHGVGTVDLMKINIEGGEYELLERMLDAGLIGSIKDVQVQFHNFTTDASARMEDIQRRLLATHEPTYQYRFIWENWRRKSGVGTNERGIVPR